MSYCRFENTYRDLQDCADALAEAGSLKQTQAYRNKREAYYVRQLVTLCRVIAEEYGEQLDKP